jgi:Protein of unknown function (DUF4238)
MNYHDLSTDTLVLDGIPVATPNSFIEVYKQDEYVQDVDYIEKHFAQLESETDRIIDKIDGSIDKGWVTLERGEINTLRKFLFILSYRNGHRSRQFVEERFDDATLQRIKAFQAEHRLPDIRSVWFFNLKNILASKHWQVASNPKIFFADRLDYNVEQDWFHLGFFCTREGLDFIFTGMELSEGSPIQDPILRLTFDTMFGESRYWTGTQSSTERTLNLSRSWPLTPRLVVILSNNVGVVQNQFSPGAIHTAPPYDIQKSYLHDLPKTRYTVTWNPPLSPATIHMFSEPIATFTLKHHRLRREFEEMNKLDGRNIDTRVKDLLHFQISRLTEEQSVRVNVLLLDHCDINVVFITARSLQRALRRYAREGFMRAREDGGVSFEKLEQKLAVEEPNQTKGAHSQTQITWIHKRGVQVGIWNVLVVLSLLLYSHVLL